MFCHSNLCKELHMPQFGLRAVRTLRTIHHNNLDLRHREYYRVFTMDWVVAVVPLLAAFSLAILAQLQLSVDMVYIHTDAHF